jgi:protein-disulfide isomerase
MVAEREAREAREKRRRRTIGSLVIAGFLVVGLVLGGYGWWLSHRTPTPTASTNPERVAFAKVSVGQDQPIRVGSASARNTVAVYLDFNCSHCRDFETAFGPTLTRLQDSGSVAVEYWPMAFINPQSQLQSNAFRCAAEIDAGFGRDVHDALFANAGTQWDNAKLVRLGRSLKPDAPTAYDTCVQNGTHVQWALDLTRVAFAGPAKNGTPTVYVNGIEFPLTQTPQQLEARLS